ncbi:glycosyltransferase [Actinoplanes sp. NPDC049118]|uniref:glycosyltransferase n=1 Tax=Actinoplanes sp. NPDC049118 TaxID=3155769 RepID=UPI0033DD6A22
MTMGIWCAEFELSGDTGPTGVVPYAGEDTQRLLVRLHGEPIGYVTLKAASDPLEVAWRELHGAISDHLRSEGISVADAPVATRVLAATDRCPDLPVAAGGVSVVVCTRNRAAMLASCLDRLGLIDYPDVEFIVVDNAPSDDSTLQLVREVQARDPRFRYELEERPGLSYARNRGLAAARGKYIAYTDDDVSVDPHWVHGIVKGFRRNRDVQCVTGLVCTAAITNDAEAYFDARTSSWSSRCAPQLFDLTPESRPNSLYPYSAGIFGTGASFAFVRDSLIEIGGFDEALGAGTATRGGEDLDIFVRVLRGGGSIAYEPSALVWHHHRADDKSLSDQMYGYGAGLTAYLTKLLLQRSTGFDVISRVPAGLIRIGMIRRGTVKRMASPASRPKRMLSREFAGYLAGPILYARARRTAARAGSAAR